MALTAEEYKELRDLVNTPGAQVDDATRTAALQATAEYENQNLQGYADAGGGKPTVEDLSGKLDPNLPLVPQALSIQPSTTHPGGDEAAQNEWSVNAGKGDATFVYDAPVKIAREKMLSDPAMVAAIYPEMPPDPQALANMKPGDEYHQAYNDFEWRRVAEQAAKAGTTAYRYSKSPWLHGEGMTTVDTLSAKVKGSLKPYGEGVRSFVIGVDDTAALGAGRKAVETVNPQFAEPNELLGIKSEGGIPTTDAKNANAMAVDEHPALHALGQGTGLLVGWSPSNLLFKAATEGSKRVIGAGAGLIKRTLAAGTAGAVGAAGEQMAREGVDAAANVAQGQDPGTLAEAGERVKGAGIGGLAFGTAGHLAGEAAQGVAQNIASGPRFRGLPEQLEKQGVEFSALKGPITPKPLLDAEREAVGRGLPASRAGDVIAEKIAPKVAKAASAEHAAKMQQVEAQQNEYLATPEAKIRRPATNLVSTTLDLLRKKHGQTDEGLQRLQVDGPTPKLKKVFNNEVGKVSLEPTKGAIEMTPDEAEAFLDSRHQQALLGGPPAPSGGGGPSIKPQPPVPVGEAPTVPPKGKAAKAAGKVEAIPDRDMKPTFRTEATNQGMKEQEVIAEARPGLRKDAEVGKKLDKEFGSDANVQRLKDERGALYPEEVRGPTPKAAPEEEWRKNAREQAAARRSPEDVKKSLAAALDPEEAKIVGGHKLGRYFEINDALRGQGKMTPELKKEAETIGRVFKKAIDSGNTYAGPTRRGIQVTPAEAKQLESAGTLTNQGFMSSSTDTKVAKHFSDLGGGSSEQSVPIIFELEGKTGVPLGKAQGEIVHRPGTQFKIVGKSKEGDAVVYRLQESGYAPGTKSEGVLAGGMLAIGAAEAATSDEEGAGGAQAAAGGLGLALALKRRGIGKVYVVPQHRNAAEQAEVTRGFKPKATDDPDVMKVLRRAALKDRDAWTRNGQPGGWSALQGEHSKLIGEGKQIKQLAGGTPDKAFKVLSAHGKSKAGELLSVEALRKAADKAGVREQLEQIRMLHPLEQLQAQSSLTARGSLPVGRRGIANAAIDAGGIRLFPGLRSLGGEQSAIRGGMAGRAELLRDDKKEKEAR